jgi:hypothetical protein
MNDNEDVKEKKANKKFMDYYADPEYREKHLKYMREKVECSCGRTVTRGNMATHKKTKMHTTRLAEKTPDKEFIEEIKNLLTMLKRK